MPPENIKKIDPGKLYIHTPEGPQPLGSITEATAIEAEEPEWAEDCPAVIKAAPEATFTAEVKIDPEVAKAFTRLAETCRQTAEALVECFRAAAGCITAWWEQNGGLGVMLHKALEMKAALNEAPPRVRHLAEHGKKYRTRKKNINRALKGYERRR